MRGYLTDRNLRRGFVLALFLGLVVLFRQLFLLLVFFVVFHRILGGTAEALQRRTGLGFRWSVLAVVAVFAGLLGLGVFVGVETLVAHVPKIRHSAAAIAHAVRESALYHRYDHSLGIVSRAQVLNTGREHAGTAMLWLERVARDVLYLFIALIFAVVFLLEREELFRWREEMASDAASRILVRYLGHLADSIAITLRLQVIVAVVNTLVTLPVLLLLRLPGIPALVMMLLVTGLIPVVGGPIAGGVLMVLAFFIRGPMGLGVFVVSTFVLHKIESYYLNPKLTAKHVHLPSFVIIVSLVLFEHVFGLVGIFLSFPSLYVAAKIREGWIDPAYEARDDEEAERALRRLLPHLKGFRLKPGVVPEAAEPPDPPSEPEK